MVEATDRPAESVQGLLVFLASLSHGLENVLGRSASTITYRAGRTIALRDKTEVKETDVLKALERVRERLQAVGIHWPFEVYKPAAQSDLILERDGKKVLRLVFHHCMVRCALFRYSHEQKQSLCLMNHGVFCGHLQSVLGKRADLEIVHAGESACLKELVIHD